MLSGSISEFKQNPGEVIEVWRGGPAAVLNRNRPAFYTVFPELMAEMGELYDQRQLTNLVRSRLKSVKRAVKVDTDDL
ncbi:antitoxin [Caballeronia sp. INDeC2]|uniref:antitoxin n=1 Tax=Caballeronia sp. INDeC2 TaxID=2921747 RepID=UPI0020293564|nr:antitoxin [Caballeronia sp. INDeC2]